MSACCAFGKFFGHTCATGARRIEPAGPGPPPAHFIGRVGDDAMGRSGEFVRPCWLGAGGEEMVARHPHFSLNVADVFESHGQVFIFGVTLFQCFS